MTTPPHQSVEDPGWAKRLYEAFAPVREALSDRDDGELDSILEEALKHVRSERARERARHAE